MNPATTNQASRDRHEASLGGCRKDAMLPVGTPGPRPGARSRRNLMMGVPQDPYPLPRYPRYYSLDLWRGAACLSVVVYHTTMVCCLHTAHGSGWADTVVAQT